MAGKPGFRTARTADLDALVALEERCFAGDRMSRRSYAAALRNPRALLLVIPGDTSLLAAATAFSRADSPAARLYSIAVDPAARGAGLGRRLLQAMETALRRRGAGALRLEVSTGNKSALALYRKSGYGIIGRIARYYEDGSDAWRLEKRLGGGLPRQKRAG
ncbi:GNAT family N-acetyltransferase [Ferrovibrio sp.]|uniref:GNAT family N-acetyltransferase n=1 Tax=Ferrovibrio sp. TaxID=1917215 RepID=UPI003517229C